MTKIKNSGERLPSVGYLLVFTAILLPLASALEYVLEHAIYLLWEGVTSGAIPPGESLPTTEIVAGVIISIEYLVDVAEAVIPSLALFLMLLALASGGVRPAAVILGISAASRLLYLVPHYYMEHIAEFYDTPESLSFAIISSLAVILLYALELSALLPLALLPSIIQSKRKKAALSDTLSEAISDKAVIDVGSPFVSFAGIVALVQFLKLFILSTVGVISELTASGGLVASESVWGYVIEYTFALLVLVGVHFNLVLVRKVVLGINNKILARREAKGE